ncbi:MAG: hypothetical protein WKG07_32695 [Hymenobacter sp.]
MRGNIETNNNADWAFAQHGEGCYSDLVGNITTNTPSASSSLFILGGVIDFTGRMTCWIKACCRNAIRTWAAAGCG